MQTFLIVSILSVNLMNVSSLEPGIKDSVQPNGSYFPSGTWRQGNRQKVLE